MKCKITKFVAIITAIVLSFSITANAKQTNSKTVILGGTPFGLKLFTNGVVVIEVEDDAQSPAKKVDIKVNDIITAANGRVVESNEQLKSEIESCNGKNVELTIKRDNKTIYKNITPTKNTNDIYTAGMWVRDSTAGIGTITYFDDSNHTFGALGHGICDKDTGMLLPLKNGEITSSIISSYTKAEDGNVGGLNGYFENENIGSITVNNAYGIYGNYQYTDNSRVIQIADNDEIKTGKATIITTIQGNNPKEYDVCIDALNINKNSGQNMIISVTDEELIEKTGGIVQGMSGSPIIQNGKLVGAVTHVFVNSPKKGYGICISNMMSNCAKPE